MGTKASPGKFDCYANAEPDEPLFVLLARDKHAPTLVWLWAALREIDGEDAAKVHEARECLVAMMQWATEHGKQVVGLGQAALVAVLELIRSANVGVKETIQKLASTPDGRPTSVDEFRRFLAFTTLEEPKP